MVIGFAMVFWLLSRKFSELKEASETDKTLVEWLKSMQQAIDETKKTVSQTVQHTDKNITDTLVKNTKSINTRLDQAAEVIGNLLREVGQMSEIGRSMRDLQDFLQSPKLRGNIGEQVLKDLISQMLPPETYNFQHSFRSGQKVDAIIKTAQGLIPIDSKFPMENFRKMIKAEDKSDRNAAQKEFSRDVKKHVKDIADKYILPDENTLDYALMYIPSEAVYYEITANIAELYDYAYDKRVFPVSPSTFYAFLRAVLVSLEGQKVERRAMAVMRELKGIKQESGKFGVALETLNRHITNAYNNMTAIMTSFLKLDQKISIAQSLKVPESKQLKE